MLGAFPLGRALEVWQELHHGMKATLEIEALAEEGENVVARLRERGRFAGLFRGLADLQPTGKP